MTVARTQGTLGKTGLAVSRLGLGTAEIGFAYGLGVPELPSEADAIKLLKTAVELGVTFFDTANYYGLAEDRIGKSGILKDPRVVVCTKCAKFLEDGEVLTPAQMEKKIFEQVEGSLRTLGIEILPLLLLHGPSAEQIEEGILEEIIGKLKTEGKIRFSGASTRGEEPPLALMKRNWADVVQVAFSIADQRMSARIFPRAVERGVGVVNRSVYLKGAFAGKANHLPENLVKLKWAVAVAEKIADDAGITLPELALRYTLSESAIAVSLIGTSNVAHVEAACAAMEKGPLSKDAVDALKALAIKDPGEVDPARWPKKA
ncbi:MAG: aldo/keto reductase [bacterium]|nr:aldo/keto reductase [bacterium]